MTKRWGGLSVGIGGVANRFVVFTPQITADDDPFREFNGVRLSSLIDQPNYRGMIAGVLTPDSRIDTGPLVRVEAGGALTFGDYIKTDDQGRAVKAADKYEAQGRCTTYGVQAGDLAWVILSPSPIWPDKPSSLTTIPGITVEAAIANSGYTVSAGSGTVVDGQITLQRVVASGQANIASGPVIYIKPAAGNTYLWGAISLSPRSVQISQWGSNAIPAYSVEPYIYEALSDRITIAFRNPISTGGTVSQPIRLTYHFTW